MENEIRTIHIARSGDAISSVIVSDINGMDDIHLEMNSGDNIEVDVQQALDIIAVLQSVLAAIGELNPEQPTKESGDA